MYYEKIACILLLAGLFQIAHAQYIYNNGAHIVTSSGTSWVFDNDDFTLISTSTSNLTQFDDLKIEADASLTIDASSAPSYLTVSGDLTVASGGSLTVESTANGTSSIIIEGSSNGNVTVQRYIAAANFGTGDDGWHMLSSPVVGQNISTEFVDITESPISSDLDFFRWSETEGLWINIKRQ